MVLEPLGGRFFAVHRGSPWGAHAKLIRMEIHIALSRHKARWN